MNPLDLLKLAPWIVIAGLIAFAGVERLQIEHRDTTIAQRDATIESMKAQQQADIAAAEKAVRAAKDADADRSAKIIADLHASQADTEEKLNAATLALATAPVQIIPPGCPDPNQSPAARAFDAGLPTDYPDATAHGGEAGAGQSGRSAGSQGALRP